MSICLEGVDAETKAYFAAKEELRQFEAAVKVAEVLRGFTCEQRKQIKAQVYKVLAMGEP